MNGMVSFLTITEFFFFLSYSSQIYPQVPIWTISRESWSPSHQASEQFLRCLQEELDTDQDEDQLMVSTKRPSENTSLLLVNLKTIYVKIQILFPFSDCSCYLYCFKLICLCIHPILSQYMKVNICTDNPFSFFLSTPADQLHCSWAVGRGGTERIAGWTIGSRTRGKGTRR